MSEAAALGLLAIAGAAVMYYQYNKTPPAGVDATPNVGKNVITGLDGSLPRGIRNRNPGNIKFSTGNNWLGQMGKDAGGFVVFDTPAHGLRAMARLIKVYITKYGLNTIGAITRKWSPDINGLSGAYAAAVASYSGVAPTKIILPNDNATIAAIMRGMVAVENGQNYLNQYTASDYNAAVAAA